MASIVVIITKHMLPKAPLPDASLPFGYSNLGPSFGAGQLLYEADFDRFPTIGKIIIAWRQCPNAVHMVRQYHPGIDMKWPLLLRHPHRFSQIVNMPHQ